MGYSHGRKWTETDDQFIRDNFGKIGYKEMAEKLGSTYGAVQARATKTLGLKHYKNRKWTEEEKQFLRDNYPDKLGHYCAEELGRSFHAVHKMVEQLGLKPNWKRSYIDTLGYRVFSPTRDTKIHEHRLVLEQKLGRPLRADEIVHHIDGNKLNNHPDNLVITNRSEHAHIHGKDRGGINRKR